MTPDELLALLRLDPADALDHGRLRALRAELHRDDGEARGLLDELLSAPTRDAARRPSVPWAGVYRSPSGESKPLTEADFRWLDKLPTDPAKISDEDARVLARMALEVEPGGSDERLVRMSWGPVEDFHRQRAATGYLAALRAKHTPPPPQPSRAIDALAAAIGRETPALTASEAYSRAQAALAKATQERQQRHDDVLARAEAEAAEMGEAQGAGASDRPAA